MPRFRRRVSVRRAKRIIDGTLPRPGDHRPKPPKAPHPNRLPIDTDAVAAALADLDARAAAYAADRRAPTDGNTLPPIGVCHDCGRPVTGERRFCGTCLTHHGRL